MKFTVIGNLAYDTIIMPGGAESSIGGPVIFITRALLSLKNHIMISTKFEKIPDIFLNKQVDTSGFIKSKSARIVIYEEDKDVRIDDSGSRITFTEIPKHYLKADCILVSTLFREVSFRMLQSIRNNTQAVIALDLQGYLRHQDKFSHKVKRNKTKLSFLKNVDIIKLNDKEILIQFPQNTIEESLTLLNSAGPRVVILTLGEKGVIVYDGQDYKKFNVQVTKTKHTVGAGDTFFAAFLASYIRHKDIATSTKYAVQLTTDYLKKEY